MRNIIVLGLLGFVFSLMSASVTAGDDGPCDEELKGNDEAPKGLYGLCIAYHNAGNENSRIRIGQLYEKKANAAGYDPVIPGTGGGSRSLLPCPCWDTADLALAVADDSELEKFCGTGANSDGSMYEYFDVGAGTSRVYKFEAGEFMAGVSYCDFAGPSGGSLQIVMPPSTLTQEDIDACVEELVVAHTMLEDSGVSCD